MTIYNYRMRLGKGDDAHNDELHFQCFFKILVFGPVLLLFESVGNCYVGIRCCQTRTLEIYSMLDCYISKNGTFFLNCQTGGDEADRLELRIVLRGRLGFGAVSSRQRLQRLWCGDLKWKQSVAEILMSKVGTERKVWVCCGEVTQEVWAALVRQTKVEGKGFGDTEAVAGFAS